MDINIYQLGNLVFENIGFVPRHKTVITSQAIKIRSLNEQKINNRDRNKFEPVLISRYNLINCGFVEFDGKITNHIIDLTLIGPNRYDIYYSGKLHFQNIQYMHQLQNIHSLLSHQELDTKLFYE